MKIRFKEDYYKVIKAGTEIDLIPNAVNFWVGLNGSGKSVTSAAVMALVGGNDRSSSRFMSRPRQDELDKVELSGFEGVTEISYSSAKIRQAQWVSLDACFDLHGGAGRLHSSEGQNSMLDLVDAAKHKDDPSHLFIFDEVDCHLDVRNKHLFFDAVLPKLKGTSIVCTHDLFFLLDQKSVFDFSDKKTKTGLDFIKQYQQRYKQA